MDLFFGNIIQSGREVIIVTFGLVPLTLLRFAFDDPHRPDLGRFVLGNDSVIALHPLVRFVDVHRPHFGSGIRISARG